MFIRWLSRNLHCDTSAIPWQATYDPQIKESVCHKRENNKMEFWKGVWGYEACISQIRRQKSSLKSRQHILGWSYSIQSEILGKRPKNKLNKLKIQQNCCVERFLGIGNITSLIECTGRLFTAATRHKQR